VISRHKRDAVESNQQILTLRLLSPGMRKQMLAGGIAKRSSKGGESKQTQVYKYKKISSATPSEFYLFITNHS